MAPRILVIPPRNTMKSIIAIVKPYVVPRLAEVLRKTPQVIGVDFVEVKGFGRQKNYLNEYKGSEYSMAYVPKVMVEIRVKSDDLELVLAAIMDTTRTGRMGDGKIFILEGLASDFETPAATNTSSEGGSE